MQLWFTEEHSENVRYNVRVRKHICSLKSPFQQIDVFDTFEFGKMLVIDGYIMITEKDEFIYHEMIVLQTVSDLLEKGYTPVVIADCISSRNPYDKEIAIERMRSEGAVITTSESVLFELCRTSGAEEFRSLSKLVK
jgi:isochorismate hydrolase